MAGCGGYGREMDAEQRLDEIVSLLRLHNAMPVSDLASRLDVSHMTVRRDLKILEARNVVRLIHGGAVMTGEAGARGGIGREGYELPAAMSEMTVQKMLIGREAASLVRPGDSIIIDTGSTTEHIARALPENRDLSVLCCSLNALTAVSGKRGLRIIFSGGYFHPNTLMFESAEGIALIRKTRAEIAFISARGVDHSLGATCATSYETKTKQAMISSAKRKVLVADSSKFGVVSATWFADIEAFDTIISDKGLPDEYVRIIRERGIEMIIV